jgi:hypothetical protein
MKINVANLYKLCSLRTRNMNDFGSAASDNCNQVASTAVRDAQGRLWWRCGAHCAIISAVWGEVVAEVDDGTMES